MFFTFSKISERITDVFVFLGVFQKNEKGVPIVVQWKQIRLGTMRLWVRSVASLSGLRIWRCHELWCRSKKQLRSGVAVCVCGLQLQLQFDP